MPREPKRIKMVPADPTRCQGTAWTTDAATVRCPNKPAVVASVVEGARPGQMTLCEECQQVAIIRGMRLTYTPLPPAPADRGPVMYLILGHRDSSDLDTHVDVYPVAYYHAAEVSQANEHANLANQVAASAPDTGPSPTLWDVKHRRGYSQGPTTYTVEPVWIGPLAEDPERANQADLAEQSDE